MSISRLFTVLALVFVVGCGSAGKMTKDDWKAKAEKNFPAFARAGNYPTVDKFVAAMGKPDKTQTIEGSPWWYYQCSDGMIQMRFGVVPFMNEKKLVLMEMNDY